MSEQHIEELAYESLTLPPNINSKRILELIQKYMKQHFSDPKYLLSTPELYGLLSYLPLNTEIYRGGSFRDLGSDWTFDYSMARRWSTTDYYQQARKYPTVMRMRISDLLTALEKYQRAHNYRTIKDALNFLAGNGTTPGLSLNIDLHELHREGFAPRIMYHKIPQPSFWQKMKALKR